MGWHMETQSRVHPSKSFLSYKVNTGILRTPLEGGGNLTVSVLSPVFAPALKHLCRRTLVRKSTFFVLGKSSWVPLHS